MNFTQAVASVFSNCLDFTGRASRNEFWWWALFAFLVGVIANILDAIIFVCHYGVPSPLNSPFSNLFGLFAVLHLVNPSSGHVEKSGQPFDWSLIHINAMPFLLDNDLGRKVY